MTTKQQTAEALGGLKRRATKANRDGMTRYGLPKANALGVSMRDIQSVAKPFGKNHALADALWKSGWHEARILACFIDDPALVTPAQMDAWCRDFDNWGICDTVCFVLFDRTPHAWKKVDAWSRRKDEFVKRAAFALLWGLTVHDKNAADARFVKGLGHIEKAARDDRHFVKKAVNMALRAVGKRNVALHAAALATSKRLSIAASDSARWVGKDALRELSSASVLRRLRG